MDKTGPVQPPKKPADPADTAAPTDESAPATPAHDNLPPERAAVGPSAPAPAENSKAPEEHAPEEKAGGERPPEEKPAEEEKPPEKTAAEIAAEEKAAAEKAADDWWENFSKAVEDPNVSIYEYLRDNTLQSMDLDNKGGLSESLVAARDAALRELFALKDPEELSKKLQALEKNALLFNPNARAVMKVSRAVLDTYIKTRKDTKDGAPPEDMGAAVGANLKRELEDAREEMNPALESVARSLKDKDEREVAATIRKAAVRMGEERSVMAMMRDAATFKRRYMKHDNVVNIAIIALPLITWEYRWALAIGLGAFAARHSVRHGFNAAKALAKGNRTEARAQTREAVTNLKSAGGSVLLIALTPALAKYPALAAGFLVFAIEAAYHKVLDTFNKMLAEEEKAPGSTTLGRRMKAGIKTFFVTYQDTLGALTAKTLKTLAPGTVGDTAEALSKRLPFSKMRKVVSRTWSLTGALTKRFNRVARAKAAEWRDDVADMGRDFVNAIEGALSDAATAATQREAEAIAAQLILEERMRAQAEEEARRKAEAEKSEAEEPAEEAHIEEEMTEEQRAQAIKKRRLEAVERAERQAEAQKRARTLKARPD